MNKFLRWYLNVPDSNLVDILKLNCQGIENNYNSDEVFERVKKFMELT